MLDLDNRVARGARHEAAHGLIASQLLGVDQVVAIWFRPDGKGATEFRPPSGSWAALEDHLVIVLAGIAVTGLESAEQARQLVPSGCAGDDRRAASLARRLAAVANGSFYAVLERAQDRADRLVSRYRPAIELLAAALWANNGSLVGSEVRLAIAAALEGSIWVRAEEPGTSTRTKTRTGEEPESGRLPIRPRFAGPGWTDDEIERLIHGSRHFAGPRFKTFAGLAEYLSGQNRWREVWAAFSGPSTGPADNLVSIVRGALRAELARPGTAPHAS
jgi:hypothetical protein